MNRQTLGFVSFLQKQFKAHFCCVLFQFSLFLFPHGTKGKKTSSCLSQATQKRGEKQRGKRKTVGVEGDGEWRVAGEEILSFPAHNGLVSMTGQLQICFILLWLCVCGNGRLPVNWSL